MLQIFAPISYVRVGRWLGKLLLLHGIQANVVATLVQCGQVDSSLCFFCCYFAFYSFYARFLFVWQIRKLHRQPSIYRCVCHSMMLLDYISIQEWKKRIVANRCVGVGLVLQLFNLLFCWSSEEVRNFYLCFLLLDLATMQGSDKRILGYICDACKRHFASRFAYDRHQRSKFLQGTSLQWSSSAI